MTPAERQAVREETLQEALETVAMVPIVMIWRGGALLSAGAIMDALDARLAAPPVPPVPEALGDAACQLERHQWVTSRENWLCTLCGRDAIVECAGECGAGRCSKHLDRAVPEAPSEAPAVAPIPMVLHCPECRFRHIDTGEFATKVHHTHSCQNCGLTWRPAGVPTVGVQFLPGFKNAEPLGPTRGEQGEDLTACGGCGERAVVWRHDRPPTPADPCCWMREPGMWVFDCVREREEPAEPAQPPPVATEGKREVFDASRFYLDGIRSYPSGHRIEARNIDLVQRAFDAGVAAGIDAQHPREPGSGGEGTGRP